MHNYNIFINDLRNLNRNRGFFGFFSMRGDGKGPRINRYAKNPVNFYSGLTNYCHYWMTTNILGSKHRCDANISLLIANFIDVDTLENGVKPEAFINKILNINKGPTEAPFPVPTVIQDSGHGAYLIYLYRKAIPATSENISIWRETETGLVNGLDKLTRRWFGKSLADPKSTNPSRLLRMPNTWNVKYLSSDNNYTKPVKSYIVTINNDRYSLNELYNTVKNAIPDTVPSVKGINNNDTHEKTSYHYASSGILPISRNGVKKIHEFLNSGMGYLVNSVAKASNPILMLKMMIPRLRKPWLKRVLKKVLTGFPKGTRNDSTLSLASQLLMTGCDAKAMIILTTIANRNSQPPMHNDELISVVKQSLKYRLKTITLYKLEREYFND